MLMRALPGDADLLPWSMDIAVESTVGTSSAARWMTRLTHRQCGAIFFGSRLLSKKRKTPHRALQKVQDKASAGCSEYVLGARERGTGRLWEEAERTLGSVQAGWPNEGHVDMASGLRSTKRSQLLPGEHRAGRPVLEAYAHM